MSRMRALMDAIGSTWSNRIARVVEGAKAAENRNPGMGRFFADGYRSGYWDGVNDTIRAAATTEGGITIVASAAEA